LQTRLKVARRQVQTQEKLLSLINLLYGDLPLRTAENPVGYAGNRQEFTSTLVCIAFWGAAWLVAGSLKKRDPLPARPLRHE